MQGHVHTACWSPCSSILLFTTTEEPVIFCLNFGGESANAAVPVADLTQVAVGEEGEV
jgi:hypothetical protein